MSTSRSLKLMLLLAGGVVGAAIAGATRLAFNATPSLPRGFYYLSRGAPLQRGALVSFPVPDPVRGLVFHRAYLPARADLFKHIVGLPGDHVCVQDGRYEVNGAEIGPVLAHDLLGRALP